jgi:hypothetical protein
VSPRAGLDEVKKILDPTGDCNSDPSVAIPAPTYNRRLCTSVNPTPHMQRGQEVHANGSALAIDWARFGFVVSVAMWNQWFAMALV